MRFKTKKLIAMLMALVMLLSLMPVSVFAGEGDVPEDEGQNPEAEIVEKSSVETSAEPEAVKEVQEETPAETEAVRETTGADDESKVENSDQFASNQKTATSGENTNEKGTPAVDDFTFTAPGDLTYDGQAKVATVTSSINGMGTITVKYSSDNGSTWFNVAPVNADTYKVAIDVAESDNIKAATSLTADEWTFTIAKATPTADMFVFTAPGDLTYDGQPKVATVAVKDGIIGMGGITVLYEDGIASEAPIYEAPVDVTNTGYQVHIKVTEGDNYLEVNDLTSTYWQFWITSPEAKIGETPYATLADAVAAATEGQTIEITLAKEGGYTVPGISKNITIKGAVDGVVFNCEGSGSIASIPNGATFENVTMNFGGSGYHGFQGAGHITMKGCTLNGLFFSYGDMTFDGCTFNSPGSEYSMWCYAGNIAYTNCTVNCEGKFANVYNEGNDGGTPWRVTATGCTFNSTKVNKAAFNVKETGNGKMLKYDVTISNCTCNENFPAASVNAIGGLYVISPLVQVDDRNLLAESTGIKVTLNGEQKYPVAQGGTSVVELEDVTDGDRAEVFKNVTGLTEDEQKAIVQTLVKGSVATAEGATNVSEVEGVETLSIKLNSVAAEKTEEQVKVNSITFDVTPKNASGEAVSNPTSAIKFRLPLTDDFTAYAKVEHQGDADRYLEVKGNTGAKYCEVEADHFSLFTASPVNEIPAAKVATIGETEYATLAEAVAEAEDGDTITIIADCSEDVELNKQTIIVVNEGVDYTGEVALAEGANKMRLFSANELNNVSEMYNAFFGFTPAYVVAKYPDADVQIINCDNGEVVFSSNVMDTAYSFNAFNVGNGDMTIFNKLLGEPEFSSLSGGVDFEKISRNYESLTDAEKTRVGEVLPWMLPYMTWIADFEVTFDKDVTAGSMGVGGYYGSYAKEESGGIGMDIELPNDMNAGDKYRMLYDYVGMEIPYAGICLAVRTFNCGAYKLTDAIDGTTMTVSLHLYNGEEDIVIGTYDYTFPVPVAAIDNTTYKTLAEALTAAAAATDEAKTVKLLADVTENVNVTVNNKNVILDLNGKTLTGNVNATIDETEGTPVIVFSIVDNAATKGKIEGDVTVSGYGTFNMPNTATGTTQPAAIEGNVTVYGAIGFDCKANITANITTSESYSGTVKIANTAKVSGTVTASGGTVKVLSNTGNNKAEVGTITKTDGATVTITGGVFANDPSELLGDEYCAVKNSDNKFEVVKTVAKIGTVKYASLADAVVAVQNGETVQLLTDLELTETTDLPDKTFTLDLNNKTVWAKGASNGTFSIMEGNITIQNGTVKLNGPSVQGGAIYLGWSGAKLNLVNATVEAFGDTCPILAMVGSEVSITNSTLIENGEDACIHSAEISSMGTTKVIVNSGTFIANGNTSGFAWAQGGTIEIKGGKYSVGSGNAQPYPFVDKNDGYGYGYNGTVIISGGYYDRQVDAKYIAPGYVCIATPETDPNYSEYPYMIGVAPVAPTVDPQAEQQSKQQTDVPEGAETGLAEKVVEEVISEISGNTSVSGEGATNIQSTEVENKLKERITGLVDSTSQLKITVKSVATKTTETQITAINAQTVTTTKAKYDVKPWVTIETTDAQGQKTTETRVISNAELAAANVTISFRLAVPVSMKSDSVLVKHYPEGATAPDWAKTYAVQGSGNNRYVALEANAFSVYELEDLAVQGYVALNLEANAPYAVLETALSEAGTQATTAANARTIVLLKDLTGENKVSLVEVAPNVTLDLYGHNLEAKTAMAWGLVKNSASTGKLIVAQDHFAYFGGKEMAASTENVMPVWDTTGGTNGYVFYAVTEIWEQWRIALGSEEGNPKYRFQPRSSEISQILTNTENSGVKVYAEFNYTKGGKENHMIVEFGQAFLTQFLADTTNKVMYVSLLGTDDVTNITAKAYLKSEKCNFSIVSTPITTTRSN